MSDGIHTLAQRQHTTEAEVIERLAARTGHDADAAMAIRQYESGVMPLWLSQALSREDRCNIQSS